jgi:hypothetical protein
MSAAATFMREERIEARLGKLANMLVRYETANEQGQQELLYVAKKWMAHLLEIIISFSHQPSHYGLPAKRRGYLRGSLNVDEAAAAHSALRLVPCRR